MTGPHSAGGTDKFAPELVIFGIGKPARRFLHVFQSLRSARTRFIVSSPPGHHKANVKPIHEAPAFWGLAASSPSKGSHHAQHRTRQDQYRDI
jgi:hypothetical protein